MPRHPRFALGLVDEAALLTAVVGCTSTSSNPAAVDGAAATPDGQGGVSDDAPIDASSVADGGCVVPTLGVTCTADETPCQPSDARLACYEWFCNAISHSWQKDSLPCADVGTAAADDATDSGGGDGDACAPPVVCGAACVAGAHNVSTMFNDCQVWECCVPDDAGADLATDGASDSGPLHAGGG
jgi:hypothetical protein